MSLILPQQRYIIYVVFIQAVATMTVISLTEWTLLLLLNRIGFTTESSSSFFVKSVSLGMIVPLIFNVVFSYMSKYIGPILTLSYGYLLAAIGLLLLPFSRNSRVAFLIAYTLYSTCTILRIMRVNLLAHVVTHERRTSILALHQLMAPVGAMLGPFLWYVMQLWQGEIHILSKFLVLDRFTISQIFAGIAMVVSASLSYLLFKRSDTDTEVSTPTAIQQEEERPLLEESKHDCDPQQYSSISIAKHKDKESCKDELKSIIFYCTIAFFVRLSAGFHNIAFQPIMVNVFRANDAEMAWMFGLLGVVGIIPPLLITLWSSFAQDRSILLAGLLLKLVGMALYLPIFGTPGKLQILFGFLLVMKASLFFTTAAMSLITKSVSAKNRSLALGYMWSIANIGPAVIQMLISDIIMNLWGGWKFAILDVPALIGLAIIMYPSSWRLMEAKNLFCQRELS